MSLIDIMPREWSGEFALHSAADATADGNILDLKGFFGTLVLQVTGTFTGTITPKVSNDGTNFEERLAISGKTGVPTYSITAAGIYTIDVIGIKKFKAEITTYASGAITIIALGLPITAGMDNAVASLINTLNGKIDTIDTVLDGIDTVLDNIVNGTTPATTALTGSSPGTIPEYGWLDTDDEPTPLEPTKLAFGVEINTTTHAMTTKYWNGTVWQEVL